MPRSRKFRPPRESPSGFTLIELMVVISIIVLLMSILVPALNKIKDTANRTKSATQVRGIHQGIVNFAQGNGSQEYFVGLDSGGGLNDEPATGSEDVPWTDGVGENVLSVEARLAVLLGDNYFAPDYLISPSEKASIVAFDIGNPKTTSTGTDAFTEINYSYALLHVPPDKVGTRFSEWRNTLNSQAAIIGDRVIAKGGAASITDGEPSTYASLHSDSGWRGNVAYNDGHVALENDPELDNTKYGAYSLEEDDLFDDADGTPSPGARAVAAGDSALLIVRGIAPGNVENTNK